MDGRILVAGIGNIFFGDDGFGVEVAKRLATETLPHAVRVADFGIRGIHLAYELLDRRYETTILVDAAPRGGEPGTVYLIEPDLSRIDTNNCSDAHRMNVQVVFAWLKSLGGTPGKIYIVGCEPAQLDGVGLSDPALRAVEEAVKLIREVLSGAVSAAAQLKIGGENNA